MTRELSHAEVEAAARSWWNSISQGRKSSWSAQSQETKDRYRLYAGKALEAAHHVYVRSFRGEANL